jgi:hypothetical protein
MEKVGEGMTGKILEVLNNCHGRDGVAALVEIGGQVSSTPRFFLLFLLDARRIRIR